MTWSRFFDIMQANGRVVFGDVAITVNGSACDYRLVVNERKHRVEAKASKGLRVIVR